MPGGDGGVFFVNSQWTIITAVTISGLVSLTITPMLCSRFLKPNTTSQRNWIEKLSDKINHFLLFHYQRALHFVFHHPFMTLAAGLVSVGLTILLLFILPNNLSSRR